jgi:flagellar biosynthesis chaperone FliJ
MENNLADFIKYKPDELDKYLREIQRDLKIRSDVNKKLEKHVKTSEANKLVVNNFMERYDNTIEEQFKLLTSLNEQFKKEINLHKELTEKSQEYSKLLHSDRCVKLRNKLKEIKVIKQELNTFLEERGIRAPKI